MSAFDYYYGSPLEKYFISSMVSKHYMKEMGRENVSNQERISIVQKNSYPHMYEILRVNIGLLSHFEWNEKKIYFSCILKLKKKKEKKGQLLISVWCHFESELLLLFFIHLTNHLYCIRNIVNINSCNKRRTS